MIFGSSFYTKYLPAFLWIFFSVSVSAQQNVAPYQVVINEIMADVNPPPNQLPVYDYVELYNRSNDTVLLANWTIRWGAQEKTFPENARILPNSYLILSDDDSGYENFGNMIAFSSFPVNVEALMELLDQNGRLIHSLDYKKSWYHDPDKDDGGWALEMIDFDNPCGGIGNFQASLDERGGTPGMLNSVFAPNPDTILPSIQNISIISSHSIHLLFSEQIIFTNALLNPQNYLISPDVGTASSIIILGSSEIQLEFSGSIEQNKSYSLQINASVEDCAGNVNVNPSFVFSLYFAKENEILIHEIMADPNPAVDELPEYEYVELYNTTLFPVKLDGWVLQINESEKILPTGTTIGPNAYLILAHEESGFQSYGHFIGFSGFSIPNRSAQLVLLNTENEVMHQINFSENWYQNDYKKEGGWSLEMIDPQNPCGESENWSASENLQGGTPGRQNSVHSENLDNQKPELLRAAVIDSVTVICYFSESLQAESCQASYFSISQNIGTPLTISPVSPGNKSIILNLQTPLEQNKIYNLTVSLELQDCVGNTLSAENTTALAIPVLASANQIIINEILSKPIDGQVDFVEIYNHSQQVFDMKDYLIGSYDSIRMEFDKMKEATAEHFLLFPQDFLVLTSNQKKIKEYYRAENEKQFIDVQDFPNYNDNEDVVVLAGKNLTVIDLVSYKEDWHFDLFNSHEGVSLERIRPDEASNDKSNWHSAAENVNYATPSYENSQFMQSGTIQGEIELSHKTFSPDNDGLEDVLSINYRFSDNGMLANVSIYNANGQLVRNLKNNVLLGTIGKWNWDGKDDEHLQVDIGPYIIFIEVFNTEGKTNKFKKIVNVAKRIN